jgi:hypothetical protein
MPYTTSTEEWLKSLPRVSGQRLARGHWTKPNSTEKYGPKWKGWIKGRPGDRELPPIVDPSAKATLPRTRLDEMLARQQLTGSEYALAVMFQERPCGPSVLRGYYATVVGIVLDGKAAGELADPRVSRPKGIDEVMRKLRIGLRLMVDHYLPEDGHPDEVEATRLDPELYKRLQEHERDFSGYNAPSRDRKWSHVIGRDRGVGRLPDGRIEFERLIPLSIDAHVSAWRSRKPGNYGGPIWRGKMAKRAWSAQMHRASAIKQSWRSMPKKRLSMLADGAGDRK